MPLDENIAGFLKFLEASGQPPIAESTVDQARAGFRALTVDYRDPATLPQVRSIEDIRIDDAVPARVYRPDVDGAIPTIVYLHGGGFVIGDLDTHEGSCRLLANDTGAVVVSVDYRLAPDHVFPAAVDDCWAALQWAAAHVDELGGDASRLAVGGDSAGGNLAAVCAQRARDAGIPLAAQLLVYPAVDMLGEYASRVENAEGYFLTAADMQWFAAQYLGLAASHPDAVAVATSPHVSPLRAESLEGLAPAVVVTAEFDPLRDEGNAYAEALEKAGNRVVHRQFPGLIHGFYGMELLSPAVAEATRWTNAALKDLLG